MRALVFVLLLAFGCDRDNTEDLPAIAALPSFALTDQSGRPFGLDDMKGHPTVVSFIFTSCRSICPTLTTQMRGLQRRFGAHGIRFVSFSVDPEADTPEVLERYAASYEADLSTWRFVTGDTSEVNRTVVRGFRVAMGEPIANPEGGGYDIMHSSHLVLVDRDGTIRGYYASDTEGMSRLAHDLERMNEGES